MHFTTLIDSITFPFSTTHDRITHHLPSIANDCNPAEVNSELDRGSSESGSANDGRGQGKECSAPHCTTDTAHAGALC